MKRLTITSKKLARLLVLALLPAFGCTDLAGQTAIQIGTVYGFSQAPSSTANYLLNVQVPGEITIHINNWLSTYDWGKDFDRIYVYNSDTNPIGRNSLSSAADPFLFQMFQSNSGLTFDVGKAGIYTVKVHSGEYNQVDWGTATGQNYNLSVTEVFCGDTNEPNETISTATPISLGTKINAFQWRQINTTQIWGDEDIYKLTISTPGKLRIELVDWIGVYDWGKDFDRLFVYNADSTSIGSSGGYNFYSWMMGGGTDTVPVVIEMNLTHAGSYYLRFHAGAGTSINPYHFTTSFTAANDPYEPNDNFADAKLIQSADVWYQAFEWRSLDSTMNITGDEDFYYFYAAGPGQYSLMLTDWIGIYDWGLNYDRMFLYDSNHNTVGASPLSWMMGTAPINFNIPAAGKYYIQLHCGAGYSINGYKFKLSGLVAVGAEGVVQPVSEFYIYPNPASSIITVNVFDRNASDLRLNIFDIVGKFIRSETLTRNNQQIKVDDLKNGVYIMEVKSNEGEEMQRLIIQR